MLKRALILITSSLLLACKTYLGQADKETALAQGSANQANPQDPSEPLYTVGGTVQGLSGTLVLQNNGGDNLVLTANGAFTFPTPLPDGDLYEVTVHANPPGQVCMVENHEGQIEGAPVTNVLVVCDHDTAWVQDAYLKSPYLEVGDKFGAVMATSGSVVAIAAVGDNSRETVVINANGQGPTDNSGSGVGAVYVFRRDTTGSQCTIPAGESGCWYQDAYLKPSNANDDQGFGSAVAVHGNTIVVGAVGEKSPETTITNENGQASADDSSMGVGAVYVFQWDKTGSHCSIPPGEQGCWYQDAYLKPSNADVYWSFGSAVAIFGDTIVVGAPGESADETVITNTNGQASADTSSPNSGAVFVFKKDKTGTHCSIPSGEQGCWYQDAYLKASNSEDYLGFGSAVAIHGQTIVVGAPSEASGSTSIINGNGQASSDTSAPSTGAVYVFEQDKTGNHCSIPPGELGCWYQDGYLKASNAAMSSFFGHSVAISGNTIAVGAYGESADAATQNANGMASHNTSAPDSGAVYVFARDFTGTACTIPLGESWCWYQDAYLKASNVHQNQKFGYSVAISGSTILVGANGDRANSQTIVNTNNQASADTSGNHVGAAFVFQKDAAGNWYQDAYLKGSNGESSDELGYCVGISGATVVVTAKGEASDDTTVINANGQPGPDHGHDPLGAAYAFRIMP